MAGGAPAIQIAATQYANQQFKFKHFGPDFVAIMTPEAALEAQIARYRRMTGEERLASELYELSCDVAWEGIRHQHPGITDAEVEQLLQQRLELVTRP